MKKQELAEIEEFFLSRQDTEEGKAEYYKIKLQAENLRLLSEIRRGITEIKGAISKSSDSVIQSIQSRLWPLVSLYDLSEDDEKDEDQG